MRLIDADALIELWKGCTFNGDITPIIANAPTIEERKKGKWIWQIFSKYMCSECGQMTTVDECMEEPMYIYCPYCGAKMEEGGQDA